MEEARSSFRSESNVFSRSSLADRDDDEEALKWVAMEKLPSVTRLRTAALGDSRRFTDVAKLGIAHREQLLQKVLQESNEIFLRKLRDRIDRVGIDLPRIELRFEHLSVDADAHIGGRALPTLLNFSLNIIEGLLGSLHLSPSKKQSLSILRDVSGIIKPCRLTLLLGPPCSGKTTFLKALGGKLDAELKVKGRVTYNGHEFNEFYPHRTSAYIGQNDLHIAEMTVRETVDFSARCQGVGNRYDMLIELCKREKAAGIKPDLDIDAFMKAGAVEGQESSIVTDYVLKILGLDICANTLVGDQMRRGISGGQKKRLTTAEMLVGPAKALLMDEISTGLDSSTTYQIVKHLKQTVTVMDSTIIVSLLQPPPEVFNMFDDLILLAEGHIIYQGPCDLVLPFFESLGFKCPERKGVADFLQEITSWKDQGQYWTDSSKPYTYVSVLEFAEAFKKFFVGQKLLEELAVPYDKRRSHPAALVTRAYGLSNWQLLHACFAREIILFRRNTFLYVFKTVQMTIMATISMTMFLRTEYHVVLADGIILVGSLFYAIIIVMFNGMAEMSLTIFKLPVFFKQRGLLYPAWAFTLPTLITRIPLSIMEVSIWVFITYYVVGYAPQFSRLVKQYFLLLVLHTMGMSMFRFLAGLCRHLVVANTFGSFIMLLIFVLGGFIVSKDQIHPYWIWGYWISPLAYAQKAITVNEFLSPKWSVIRGNSTKTVGIQVLEARKLSVHASSYWVGIGAIMGFIFVYNFLYTVALTYLNPLGKAQAVLSDENEKTNEKTVSGGGSADSGLSNTTAEESSEISAASEPRKGMVLPFKQLSLAFDHVSYIIDMPQEAKQEGVTQDRLQLLRDVSGAFRPGVLTALVGVSGAGKTTLMDVLAGRKTGGYIEGNITINGYPKKQETFARIAGYCEQNDIHSPYVTVHEALIYSAWLRLSKDVDKHTRTMFVEEVMELIELTNLQGALVGVPGASGLSVEQRKRLTVAVELVANPSIIFMDEPTSGLDARAAAIVMRTVRNTVNTGRTVVCTIHQPSIDIFESFDELLLLKRGGQSIYAGALGKESQYLVEYFQGITGIPRIKDGYNPAAWMLEVTTPEMEESLGVDFAEIYSNSLTYKRNEELIAEISKPPPNSKDLHFPTKYSQSFATQCAACLWKQYWSYWRNPSYNVVRFFYTTICGFLFGTIFWGLGRHIRSEQQLFNVMGSMYASVLFIGVNNCMAVQPIVGIERTVFYRERAAGMYSPFPYAIAQVVVEIPYNLLQSILFIIILFPMAGYDWSAARFFYYLFFMCTVFLYFTYYGFMLVGLTPNLHIAAVITAAFFGIWNLFSGFLLPRKRIPVWWRWYYWCDPVAWSLEGLITSQLGDKKTRISVPGTQPQMIEDYLRAHFGFRRSFLGPDVAVHIFVVVLFAAVFAISIKLFNFQKR